MNSLVADPALIVPGVTAWSYQDFRKGHQVLSEFDSTYPMEYTRTKTTNTIIFDRKERMPQERELRDALGTVFDVYEDILKLTDGFAREWKYYSAKYGWQLKFVHKGKALFYLVPMEKAFLVGLAVRESEKDALLRSKLPAKAKKELESAKRYPEGFPLRLRVSKKGDMRAIRLVVDTLKSSRL